MKTGSDAPKVKTTVFNLIILDESGSMSNARTATISGCNECLGVARSLQKENPDTQRCLVSIYAFQSGSVPSRYLVKNKSVENVKDITSRDYNPMGCTPLLDAVGMTLTDLKAVASTHEDATGVITIITDGYENSSQEYTWKDVSRLISEFKEQGWAVNLIGANIDVEEMATKMNIEVANAMAFENDDLGTEKMFGSFSNAQMAYHRERTSRESVARSDEEKRDIRKQMSKDFWNR